VCGRCLGCRAEPASSQSQVAATVLTGRLFNSCRVLSPLLLLPCYSMVACCVAVDCRHRRLFSPVKGKATSKSPADTAAAPDQTMS
jgi:hypothetical protein